ncbi:2Fe-2S iron-sulfur cluster binding domain-containing protein [Azotobacter beijerinckii]|uniref:2Fe-2S iron-sulfur cluster binding domain-containing protein n=1 Tax=Azotobacter beijerinckii TaxID=170623 RepID=A0A1H6T1H8_9GAMM|nr:2Fe-2S iron-sulfur cluster binding domain-containing protein [Azotobacter beijerinckii]SEI73979.1 2Fe-2S iron-sulfur cluster binding domain-containing protein [Azotobacter beijerinckii]SEJ52780.1 2Fe-2S iron-sulfur cluster binding domain-containing protein [Azotobacter beijerinckii]SER90094.1 2Fe-2S iron-sulfur cluster binding domain-containing protein [Azotobacter beijerinckii]
MSRPHRVLEQVSGEVVDVRPGESLLRAMERQGKRCIPVGCRGGGCGVCKVRIVSGRFDHGLMSCSHVDVGQRRQGLALACRLFPLGDSEVQACGEPGRATPEQQ